HERLWVAITSVIDYKGYNTDNAGQAALLEFDLDTGKLAHRYPVPGYSVFMSSVALGPDGPVYHADGGNCVQYTPNDGTLQVVARNPRLTAITALAVSSDGRNLYLADSLRGVIGLDLDSGEPFALGYNPATLVLPGIADMHIYRDTLVVTQPGMQPQRVMR